MVFEFDRLKIWEIYSTNYRHTYVFREIGQFYEL